MTRLFGCTCNQPQRLSESLSPVRAQLVARAPVPRWGLGYVHGGEVLLSRTPKMSEKDVDLFAALERLPSDYVIANAADDDGLRGNDNTQPFRFRRWMWAQEGRVGGEVAAVHTGLLEHVPDFMRRNIKGKTTSEYVFHVFLSLLHDQGSLDDSKLSPAATRRALQAALAIVYGQVTKSGGNAELGNLVVSNARSLLAARLDKPLYMRTLTVINGRDARDPSFRGLLVLSSDEDPGEGFEEVPARSVLMVSRDLRTDIAHLDS